MATKEPVGCLFSIFKLFGISAPPAEKPAELPYERKDYLFTKAERAFFGVLAHTVADEYWVFAKVRIADVVSIRKGSAKWQSHFNRIQAKHIDFLLCDHATIRPLLGIELDDSSHQRQSRQVRDKFVDDVLEAANLPLLRVSARSAYNVDDLRKQIQACLDRSAS